MQKEHRCPREQFCKSFFGFRSRTAKRKSMKSGFGFLNWNPSWRRISRRRNPFSDFAFDRKIRNPDFPIERNPTIHSYNTRSSPSIACVTSVSTRVRRERRDESKKKEMTGEGDRFRSNFRAITRLETLATQATPSNNLCIKTSRLDIQKRAFSRVGAKIWNDIPAPKKTLQNETPVFPCWYPNLWTWWLQWSFPNYLCSENV